jgi:hypothetical protein
MPSPGARPARARRPCPYQRQRQRDNTPALFVCADHRGQRQRRPTLRTRGRQTSPGRRPAPTKPLRAHLPSPATARAHATALRVRWLSPGRRRGRTARLIVRASRHQQPRRAPTLRTRDRWTTPGRQPAPTKPLRAHLPSPATTARVHTANPWSLGDLGATAGSHGTVTCAPTVASNDAGPRHGSSGALAVAGDGEVARRGRSCAPAVTSSHGARPHCEPVTAGRRQDDSQLPRNRSVCACRRQRQRRQPTPRIRGCWATSGRQLAPTKLFRAHLPSLATAWSHGAVDRVRQPAPATTLRAHTAHPWSLSVARTTAGSHGTVTCAPAVASDGAGPRRGLSGSAGCRWRRCGRTARLIVCANRR